MPAVVGFTTLAKVKKELQIPAADETHDARLQAIVDGVNGMFLGWFNLSTSEKTNYTHKYDVFDARTDGLWLIEYPVSGFSSVKIDDVAQDLTDFYLAHPAKMGLLTVLESRWAGYYPFGRQRVEVTHEAGWDPADPGFLALCNAATMQAIYQSNVTPGKGLKSEKIGQYSYTTDTAGGRGGSAGGGARLDPDVALVVQAHVRPFAI